MARRLISLILAQLNMNFAISHSRYHYLKKRERLWEPVLIAISIGIVAATFGFGIYRLALTFYDATLKLGQGDVTLTIGILLSQIVVLALGFALVIAVFYFSNDPGILIPLPLRPVEVLLGKFSVILANEYVGLSVILIPLLVAYGVKADVSPVAYGVSALLIFLAIPVIPLVIAAIPAILLMRVTNPSRRKDTLVMIGGFLFIALIVGFQVFVQTRGPGPGEEAQFLAKILSAANSLVDIVGRNFPPSAWATKALAGAGTPSGLLYLFIFIGASALCLAILLVIGNKVFYQGLVGGSEAGSRKRAKAPPVGLSMKRFLQRSPIATLALAEVRLFTRTPVFVINGFTGFVVFPVMFIIPSIAAGMSVDLQPLLEKVLALPEIGAVGALVIGAYLLILAAMSSIPVTPFSRDGNRNIWILKSLPVSGKTVMLGKALGAAAMIVPGSIPGIAVLEYISKLPPVYLLAGVVMGVIASLVFCLWGIILDMVRPMLNWTDQQKAVKSNLNVVIGMLLGFAMVAALGFIVMLVFNVRIPGWAIVIGMILLLVTILGATVRLAGAIAERVWLSERG